MNRQLFINLPVADLEAARRFYAALGFGFNDQFCGDDASCVVVSEAISIMLLTPEKFASFAPRPIARDGIEVLNCLSFDSREDVDRLVAAGVSAGGATFKEPIDYGWMYGHSVCDPDGHAWELMWMDPDGMPEKQAASA
jgi:predicted lactoylglutathione lyase